MFTDMVGYTALGQWNEELSLALLDEESVNAPDATRCAYDIQRAVREFNISLPAEARIGLHLGDVAEFEGNISGDAVNIASRIEPLAGEGEVCLTAYYWNERTLGRL